MFLKQIFARESDASRANMLVLRTSKFQGATIRPIVPRHKHSIVLWAESVSPRTNTTASRDQFKPIRIGENLVANYNG